ncbi:hypothetical protein VFPFJ_04896 [Purpureocillium lilacinum]|uniref:Uncharacterized protein n=1 Tax=Purpureocillium lilacinum TaxID=33203 RepID=A0A179HKC9_PURLI|nr:hypothetical protein VFPFJ_04896 [Purpureocillium lilacinum]OAQ90737.1 hypothetical protein VFPFJ_04896 [Purpureocillium lilacinum]
MGRTAESNDRWGVCASAGSRIDRGWAEPRRRVAESSREGSSRRRDRRGPEGGDGRRARRSRGRDALAYTWWQGRQCRCRTGDESVDAAKEI